MKRSVVFTEDQIYEKFYIEKLIKENKKLPQMGEIITTPYGVYYSDFSYGISLVEIKSDYTYDVLERKRLHNIEKLNG